ncbi:MAG: Ca2+-dependent phosphoinositide-specific phospholipase C [Cyanobacteria bacterium P01_G01_bin.39]
MTDPKDFPYNQVCFKGSHNSYERDGIAIAQQIEKGCRGLELDIAQSADGEDWSVEHDDKYFSDPEKQLAKYLAELNTWSIDNAGHDVITVHLDLKKANYKSNTSKFPEELDRYIRNNIDPARIFCPKDLMGKKVSLAHGARTYGWPKLKDLDGKFIFCLTGNDVLSLKQLAKKHYAATLPKERLCFTDLRKKRGGKPNPGRTIYFNYNFDDGPIKISNKDWTKIIKNFAGKDDVITRTFGLNDRQKWQRALDSGFNILVTDNIDESWAKVSKSSPFKVL